MSVELGARTSQESHIMKPNSSMDTTASSVRSMCKGTAWGGAPSEHLNLKLQQSQCAAQTRQMSALRMQYAQLRHAEMILRVRDL